MTAIIDAFTRLRAHDAIDFEHAAHDDLQPLVRGALLVLGPSETFDRVSPMFEPAHPRRAEALDAAFRAMFRGDFEWSNADAKLVAKRGWLHADERWLALAKEIRADKSIDKELRALVRDMLAK